MMARYDGGALAVGSVSTKILLLLLFLGSDIIIFTAEARVFKGERTKRGLHHFFYMLGLA
jgi:hypothetical protein